MQISAKLEEVYYDFFHFENKEQYKTQVMRHLNAINDFEKSILEKSESIDLTNPKDLEYALTCIRMMQCFGTKKKEYDSYLFKEATFEDVKFDDRLKCAEGHFCQTLINELLTSGIDLKKYPFVGSVSPSAISMLPKGSIDRRCLELIEDIKVERTKDKESITLNLDTQEIYKYAKLIKAQQEGKTTAQEDKKIERYCIDIVQSFSEISIPDTNEYDSNLSLKLNWYDLVNVNGKSLKELAGNLNQNDYSKTCTKILIDTIVNKNAQIDYLCINKIGNTIDTKVKPLYFNHDQAKYNETLTFWDKVKDFFHIERIKDFKASQDVIKEANKNGSPYKDVIVNKLADKLKDRDIKFVQETTYSKQIEVNELKEVKTLDKSQEINNSKTLEKSQEIGK